MPVWCHPRLTLIFEVLGVGHVMPSVMRGEGGVAVGPYQVQGTLQSISTSWRPTADIAMTRHLGMRQALTGMDAVTLMTLVSDVGDVGVPQPVVRERPAVCGEARGGASFVRSHSGCHALEDDSAVLRRLTVAYKASTAGFADRPGRAAAATCGAVS